MQCSFEITTIVIFSLTCVQNKITSCPKNASLAEFINRVGEHYNLTSLSVFYNTKSQAVPDVNQLLLELHQHPSSYFGSAIQISGNEESQMNLTFVVPTSALIVTFTQNLNDKILQTVAHTCRGRRQSHAIFVVADELNADERESFFKFLWQKQFLMPLLVLNNGTQMFTISAYPSLKVLNVTNVMLQKRFPNRYEFNFQGYRLRVPVQLDMPLNFWFLTNGTYTLDGTGGRIFRNFMQRLNVTLITYPLEPPPNYLNMSKIRQLLKEERIEISPHLYNTLDAEHIEYSYPYELTRRCFMVPLDNEIPRYLYLLLPFTPGVWLLLGMWIVSCTILIELMRLCQTYGKQDLKNAQAPCAGFFWALSIILARPSEINQIFRCRKPCSFKTARAFFTCLIVPFMGVCISQGYSSTLISFLTVTLLSRPNISVNSMLANAQPVMILRHEEDSIMRSSKFPDPAFRRLFTFVQTNEFNHNRNILNHSFVYPVSASRWEFLKEEQRLLQRQRFWLSNICFGEYAIQYQLQYDSHFYRPLKFFMLRVRESGLDSIWSSKSFYRAKKLGFARHFKDTDDDISSENEFGGLSLTMLLPCFYVFLVGHLLSMFVLLIELVHVRMRGLLNKQSHPPQLEHLEKNL